MVDPPGGHETAVARAYGAMAEQYTQRLGSVEAMHPADRLRIGQWAQQLPGPIVDAGCGPGHWTDFLHGRGADIAGIDLVPDFIAGARNRFPGVAFDVASMHPLDLGDETLGGVLAWYSLIHMRATEISAVLAEFSRVLSPQGQLLLGFFEGTDGEAFRHAVAPAHYRSIAQMSVLLAKAGFSVVDIETRQDPGSRPHASIAAVKTTAWEALA